MQCSTALQLDPKSSPSSRPLPPASFPRWLLTFPSILSSSSDSQSALLAALNLPPILSLKEFALGSFWKDSVFEQYLFSPKFCPSFGAFFGNIRVGPSIVRRGVGMPPYSRANAILNNTGSALVFAFKTLPCCRIHQPGNWPALHVKRI